MSTSECPLSTTLDAGNETGNDSFSTDTLHEVYGPEQLSSTQSLTVRTLHVQDPWFTAIVSGRKTVEGRTGPADKFKAGEQIVVVNGSRKACFTISKLRHFKNLGDYIDAHSSKEVLGTPGLSKELMHEAYLTIAAKSSLHYSTQIFNRKRVAERGGICALTLAPVIDRKALGHILRVPGPIYCPTGNVLFIKTSNPYLKIQYSMTRAGHAGDSGIDLFCAKSFTIRCGETLRIDLGIQCEMRRNGAPQSYYIHPRSSLSKTPLMLANSAGVIDAGYRGNLLLALKYVPTDEDLCTIINKEREQLHIGQRLPVEELPTYTVEAGQRLVQICSPDLSPIRTILCDSLTTSSRGESGFGSTGV